MVSQPSRASRCQHTSRNVVRVAPISSESSRLRSAGKIVREEAVIPDTFNNAYLL